MYRCIQGFLHFEFGAKGWVGGGGTGGLAEGNAVMSEASLVAS